LVGVILFRLDSIIPLDPFMDQTIVYGIWYGMVRTKLTLGC
jgi:hypothetical protein